jgi:prophage antirepressor-like protein
MNELKIFDNPQFGSIRTINENEKILFIASDVAKSLGYAIPTKAVNTHCKGVSKMEVPTPK